MGDRSRHTSAPPGEPAPEAASEAGATSAPGATSVSDRPDPVVEHAKQFLDESLLAENLKLTPEERLLKFFSFMELVAELQRGGEAARAEAARSAAPPSPAARDLPT